MAIDPDLEYKRAIAQGASLRQAQDVQNAASHARRRELTTGASAIDPDLEYKKAIAQGASHRQAQDVRNAAFAAARRKEISESDSSMPQDMLGIIGKLSIPWLVACMFLSSWIERLLGREINYCRQVKKLPDSVCESQDVSGLVFCAIFFGAPVILLCLIIFVTRRLR